MTGAVLAASATHAELRSFVLVLAASAGAAFVSRLAPQALLPTVVVEIVLGILIGPEVLGWASADQHVAFLSNLGLAALFFFAGIEVIGEHVPRGAIQRGSAGWCISLALGISVACLLVHLGLDANGWLVGVALSTTALGTLVPVLSDSGLLPTPLGIATLGTGVAGEFWPIIVISVFLTGIYGAVTEVLLRLAFGAIALGAAYAALRVPPPRVCSPSCGRPCTPAARPQSDSRSWW